MTRKQIAEAIYDEKKVVTTRGKKIKDAVWEYHCDHCGNELSPMRALHFLMFYPRKDMPYVNKVVLTSERDLLEFCNPEHAAHHLVKMQKQFNVEFNFSFLGENGTYTFNKFAHAYVEATLHGIPND